MCWLVFYFSESSREEACLGFLSFFLAVLLFLSADVGSQVERLDTNALRRFEACWLCNRTALSPVCTPQGLLFCKQCLFLNFEEQKKKRDKEIQEWEKQERKRKQVRLVIRTVMASCPFPCPSWQSACAFLSSDQEGRFSILLSPSPVNGEANKTLPPPSSARSAPSRALRWREEEQNLQAN